MAIESIEGYLPFSTMGIATASDGSVWLLHPPTAGGMAQLAAATTPEPPVNTTPPVITLMSGDLAVGSVFARTVGTWSPSGTPTQQWMSAGTAVPGATGATYTAQASDEGNSITCVVTMTNEDGSASATSNALGPITAPADDEPSAQAQTEQQPQTRSHHAKSPKHGKTHHARAVHR